MQQLDELINEVETAEEILKKNLWQVRYLANALSRAIRLEKLRAEFYQELYENIRIPSVSYHHDFTSMVSASTEMQAIKIINAKERYDRKVRKEYELNFRWEQLLSLVNEQERIIMIRYFRKKKSVNPEVISSILHKVKDYLREEELRLEEERTAMSSKEFRRYKDIHPENFKKKKDPNEGKHHVSIGGRFVYLTDEEFEEHKRNQEERRKLLSLWDRRG
ncbi:hypothetical protein [Chungangia koreensis]